MLTGRLVEVTIVVVKRKEVLVTVRAADINSIAHPVPARTALHRGCRP